MALVEKTVLILKPTLVAEGRIGEAITYVEKAGMAVLDCFSMRLTEADVYEYFETQDDYPQQDEVGSYLLGLSFVLAIRADKPLSGFDIEEHFDCHLGRRNGAKALVYWFGSSLDDVGGYRWM